MSGQAGASVRGRLSGRGAGWTYGVARICTQARKERANSDTLGGDRRASDSHNEGRGGERRGEEGSGNDIVTG
jgi:hypothetical protein